MAEEQIAGVVVARYEGMAHEFSDRYVKIVEAIDFQHRTPCVRIQFICRDMHNAVECASAAFQGVGHGQRLMEFEDAHHGVADAVVDSNGVIFAYKGDSYGAVYGIGE